MVNTSDKCICTDCGYEFIGIDLSVPKRPPCPMCHSTSKLISINIHDEVKTPLEVFGITTTVPKHMGGYFSKPCPLVAGSNNFVNTITAKASALFRHKKPR